MKDVNDLLARMNTGGLSTQESQDSGTLGSALDDIAAVEDQYFKAVAAGDVAAQKTLLARKAALEAQGLASMSSLLGLTRED